jgi:hypothetical protein
MLTPLFQAAYRRSLNHFKLFYDDFCLYGNPSARHVFYFIPGIDGTCGQIRFCLPSIFRVFGPDIYIKCLLLDEYSASRPIWEKITIPNAIKRKERIAADLNQLAEKYDKITIVCSSNGFYDLLFAYEALNVSIKQTVKLLWVAVAPDRFEPTRWETVFYRINGHSHEGYKWWAVPEHNLFTWINPEIGKTEVWKRQGLRKVFNKSDIESRFRCFGFQWAYNSVDACNAVLEYICRNASRPLPIPSYVLVATNDGYWQGKPVAAINTLLDTYLSNKRVLYKPMSHIWVVVPDNTEELMTLLKNDT